MSRKEFPAKVRKAAFDRAAGRCEGCGLPLDGANRGEVDHILPLGLGGTSDLDNAQVLGKCCHGPKTAHQDVPAMAKADRLRKKHLGITRPSSSLAKRNRWKPQGKTDE